MTAPKRMHWLPQFYLRGFRAQDDTGTVPRLWVCSPSRSGPITPRLMRTAEIAVRRHLHSPVRSDAGRDLSVEHKLAELESAVGGIWDRVAKERVPLGDQALRKVLALFVSTLYLRNPQRLTERQALREAIMGLLGPTPNVASSASQGQGTRSELAASLNVALLAEATRRAEALLPRRWIIVTADAHTFATCDAPVVLPDANGAPLALGVKGVTVHLPLSPARFLIIEDSTEPSGYSEASSHFAKVANYNTWLAADRYLLSSRACHVVQQEVREVESEQAPGCE